MLVWMRHSASPKLVGEWTYETEVKMESEHSIEKAMGTERVRSLDGLWIVAEGQGEMPGCGAASELSPEIKADAS